MEIIIDSREKTPFSFSSWDDVTTSVAGLSTGDYSLAGLEDMVSVERKSLVDVVNCFREPERGRFERELDRSHRLDYFIVIIEAAFAELTNKLYRSTLKPNECVQILLDLQVKHRVPFIWAGNRRAAEYLAYWTLKTYQAQHG